MFITLTAAMLLTACDSLDKNGAINEILPGDWAFNYELQSDVETGLSFSYEQVIFRADGTCAITYPDGYDEDGNVVYGALSGTYQAGDASIYIQGVLDDGVEREMLWRILSFSQKEIVAEYEFEFQGQSVTAILTLERIL